MVFSRLHIILNVLLSLAILYGTTAQNITNTTLLLGEVACANRDVNFTCQTIGSSAIAWRSEQFIGPSNTVQLLFSFDVDSPGSTRNASDPTTVATLTRNEDLNGMRLLESTLRVRAPTNSSNIPLTVTCVHLDNDVDKSVNFSVLSVPGVIQNASVIQVPCANLTACVAIASWDSPSNSQSANVTQYVGRVTLDGVEVFTTTISAGSNETALSAYYVVPNCTNNDLQIVGWSLAAVNLCGDGPRQDAVLLPNPPNNIGEDRCPAEPTSPSASFAFKPSMWIVNGAIVLTLMKSFRFQAVLDN